MERNINASTYIEEATGDVHIYESDPVLKKSIETLINRAFVADEARAVEIAGEKILDSHIQQAAEFIKKHRYKTARELLQKLQDEERAGNKYSPDSRGRIANNLGVCALHLDDIPIARGQFKEAVELDPQNAKYLSNAAMAALLDRDTEAALELSSQARSISPREMAATTVYIQALNSKSEIQNIETLIAEEPWALEDAYCLLALGAIYYSNGDYERAENYLRSALEKNDSESQIYTLLSNAIFQPALQQLQDDPPLSWKREQSITDRIGEAKYFADIEIKLLSDSDNRKQLHTAFLNRAQAKAVLRDFDSALEDCDIVLSEDEADDLALNTKGTILFHSKKYIEAIELLEKVTDPSIKEFSIIFRAMAKVRLGKYADAIDLIKPHWNPDSTKKEMIQFAEILTFAYGGLVDKSEDKTDEILEFLKNEEFKADVNAFLLKSDIYYQKRNFSDANKVLLEALEFATENQKDHIYLTLANQAYFQSNWKEAARYYSLIVAPNAPLEIKQQYAIALLNGEVYDTALEFAQTERAAGDPIPIISEVEARLLEYKGDLPAALELRLKLYESSEEKSELHLIKASMLALRQGSEDDAREIILRVDLSRIQDNAYALSHVAQAYTILGVDGAIPLAYKARVLGFNYPEYHLAYIRAFLAREDSEAAVFRPQQVENNCVVELLLSTGEKQSFLITDEEPEDMQKNTISPANPLAIKLLDKKQDEEVILRANSLQTLTAKVVEIRSKFVAAFQEAFIKFPTLFPDNQKLHSIDVADNNFSVIFSELDKRFARVRFVMQMHNEKRLPLSILAHLLERSRIKTWTHMASDADGNVFASAGNANDLKGEIISKKVVLDLIAILGAKYLGILEKLPEIFDEIFVSQAVLDELTEELVNEKVDSTKQRASLSRNLEGYTHYEYTEDDQKLYLDYLGEIQEFITAKTQVVASSTALSIDKDKLKEISDVLGESAISSILIAQEKEAVLYADDLSVNQFAQSDWNVTSVWSQIILANLRDRKIISPDDYQEGIYKLIIANYKLPSIQYDSLLWAAKKNNWKATNELQRFLKILDISVCNENWAVEAIADLMKDTVLEISQAENRLFFLDFILGALVKGRNKLTVLNKLQQRLITKFHLLPIQLTEILKTINIWKFQN